ncbi:MAG: DUF192 domain-containing protein [Candidatus Methanomethyliaceae archaeon]
MQIGYTGRRAVTWFRFSPKVEWAKIMVGHRIIAYRVFWADNFWTRLIGLLGREYLPSGECLILRPCRQIHTIGMGFPIDVVFLDREWHVVGAIKNMPPGRISPFFKDATMAIEFKGGSLPNMAPGERLVFDRTDK